MICRLFAAQALMVACLLKLGYGRQLKVCCNDPRHQVMKEAEDRSC